MLTYDVYLRYAAELYKNKEINMLEEMRELNNKTPGNNFRNYDLINLEEAIFNSNYKKVRIFDNVVELPKPEEENKEQEKDKNESNIEEDLKVDSKSNANSYFNNIKRITNSSPRNALKLAQCTKESPYRTSHLKTPNDFEFDMLSSQKETVVKKKCSNLKKDEENYKYVEVPQIPRKFIILRYQLITTLVRGQCFGDTALESKDNIR